MKDNVPADMIPTSACYGVNRIGISLVKYETDDGDVYNPQITFFLDDNKEYESDFDRKAITFVLDMVMQCPKCLAVTLVDMYATMFVDATIAAIVVLFDKDLKEIGTLNLNEDFDDHYDMEEDIEIPEKRVLH